MGLELRGEGRTRDGVLGVLIVWWQWNWKPWVWWDSLGSEHGMRTKRVQDWALGHCSHWGRKKNPKRHWNSLEGERKTKCDHIMEECMWFQESGSGHQCPWCWVVKSDGESEGRQSFQEFSCVRVGHRYTSHIDTPHDTLTLETFPAQMPSTWTRGVGLWVPNLKSYQRTSPLESAGYHLRPVDHVTSPQVASDLTIAAYITF